MADYKRLCAQLLAAVEHQHGDPSIDRLALSRRARALLAQPEPAGPTAQELRQLWAACNSPSVFARAVLARWGSQ